MKRHDLRDSSGRLLGYIEVHANGNQDGRDSSGRTRGTYDQRRDETRDASGHSVGRGNLLSVLIVQLG